ncbi:hypothetical protein N7462_004056 [Penicillium macrosclerotiorum]|uniref:uncharacterized protein n=1 Tax=Penicillium macrosclerotiorum TaxID=303699 RepID=UPI002548A9F5|nr:uncharacterized protein N7462_004056 [Penicillium macrosclerotiorum]KAJ5689664.1 hypothetical protein N7462_004056 [Penicillium macrosclerotiorum]
MASQNNSPGDAHFSFAKIAAMSAPSGPPTCPASSESDKAQPAVPSTCAETHNTEFSLSNAQKSTILHQQQSDPAIDGLERAVQGIDITLRKDREGSGSSLDDRDNASLKRENSFEDDRTHLSTSSTKMTNFDSKSLASVTTFAMDEKDSVRPDDSASVQAIDEEESLSGATSGAPNSIAGSEAGSRSLRDHFRDGNALRPRGVLPVPGLLFNGGNQRCPVVIPPDSVSNNFVVPADPATLQDNQVSRIFPVDPDEKLLEAMNSPKDRLWILQLEEKIRHFIKESNEQSLELPPSNSFCRLLAHRLGDYYHLTHFVDNNVTSVRLHRTPFSRLPIPISDVHSSMNVTPAPPVPAMKIMRRTDGERPSAEGSIAASSSIPSKAASETGDSGQEAGSGAASVKDRLNMTREEREAKYQEVRERIFRDFPESAKSEASGDSNPNMSRSSSTNGRKKNHRQRTPHDDSFEVRSQFNPYFPGMPYNGAPSYNAAMGDGPYSNQVPYMVGPGMSPPSSGYMATNQNSAMYPGQIGMNNVSQYPMQGSPQNASNGSWQGGNMSQQSSYSGYTSMNQPSVMGQQPSSKSSPAMNNFSIPQSPQYGQQSAGWNSGPFPGSFQQSPHQRNNQPPVHWPNYPAQSMTSNMAAYPYAQYPGQHLNSAIQSPSGASTLPGGFARPFNPQTRSFIPGNGPMPKHLARGPQHPMQQYGNMPSPIQNQWAGFTEPGPNRNMDHASAVNTTRMPNSNSRDSISKWGTPAHLPPKPPPSEVPSDFDLKSRAGPTAMSPSSFAGNGISVAKNGPLVVSGGTNPAKTS